MVPPRWPEVMKHREYPHENGKRKHGHGETFARHLLAMAMLPDLQDEIDIAPSFS
jgi:hypothetical protein